MHPALSQQLAVAHQLELIDDAHPVQQRHHWPRKPLGFTLRRYFIHASAADIESLRGPAGGAG